MSVALCELALTRWVQDDKDLRELIADAITSLSHLDANPQRGEPGQ